MSKVVLHYSSNSKSTVNFMISGSKSISQRALIINSLMNFNGNINNLSDSSDTQVLNDALLSSSLILNVSNSGTSLRFLISFFALKNKEVTIFGDHYLFQRPINLLIDYLNQLGANIDKKNNKIIIKKGVLKGGELYLQSMKTSQFISSLLLIGPYLTDGLRLNLPKKIYSNSYVNMTLDMLKTCGVSIKVSKDYIVVDEGRYLNPYTEIESDWSSASYLFLSFLFSELDQITISSFSKNSIQPDSSLINIFSTFGIITIFHRDKICLKRKTNIDFPKELELDFSNNPDLFLTIVIACLGLGIKLIGSGIKTLQYKESNRIQSMQNELLKFNCTLDIESDDLIYLRPKTLINTNDIISISTYNDHRIALAFSPLTLLGFKLEINNFGVVSKSYPNFFNDLKQFGVRIQK